jgi:N-methylhydantoinase A
VKPLVRRYLERVGRTGGGRLLIMQSNGGVRQASSVASRPSEVVLSGPAGGVAGALHVAGLLGVPELLTLDMGGTSTDISILLDGRAVHTTDGAIGGFPGALPRVYIDTIGAGGGSIAWRDPGGALRVGPRSAGAEPGPLAYGRGGGEVTVTDGDLLSGLLGESLLGGRLPLHRGPAEEGVAGLAQDLGLEKEATLLGVRRVVEANMARAASLGLARRGLDPRDFALLAFGGAGPLHAALLAEELGIRRVIIPVLPGLFSAYGILVSELRFEFSRSVLRPWGEAREEVEALFDPLRARAREELENHGVVVEPALLIPSLDLRYRGQSFHLNVPLGDDPEAAFHEAHQQSFGYSAPGEPLELVNLRLSVLVPRPKPLPSPPSGGCPPPAERRVLLAEGWVRAEVHERDALAPGFRTKGPAVVEEESSTTFVPPGWRLEVDGFGILHLEGP